MKNIIIVILVLSATNLAFAGGPWPQPKGKAYIKLSEWWTIFDEHYTDNGGIDPNLTSGIFNTTLYVEYGLSDRLTTVVNAPLFSRSIMNTQRSGTTNDIIVPGEGLNSVGDVDIALKYALTKPGSSIPVSISLTLGIPTGTSSAGQFGSLQTGDGEFNQHLKIDAGKSFELGSIPSYFSIHAGINNRTKEFSEEFRTGAELGIGLGEGKFWLAGKLDILRSFKNGGDAISANTTSIFANNAEFVTAGLEASYYITDRFGISASYTNTLSGRIIAAAPSYSVGIFLDLAK